MAACPTGLLRSTVGIALAQLRLEAGIRNQCLCRLSSGRNPAPHDRRLGEAEWARALMELGEDAARPRTVLRHIIVPVSDYGVDGAAALGAVNGPWIHYGVNAGANCSSYRICSSDCISGNRQVLPDCSDMHRLQWSRVKVYFYHHRQHEGGHSGAWRCTVDVHRGAVGMCVRHRYCERSDNHPDVRLGQKNLDGFEKPLFSASHPLTG